jgi:alkyl hydroperoxide reductase subunit AhpC
VILGHCEFTRTSRGIQNLREKLDVDITYPLVPDVDMKVSQLYGMIHPGASATATCARHSSSTRSAPFARSCTTR